MAEVPTGANLGEFVGAIADKVKNWHKFLDGTQERLTKIRSGLAKKSPLAGPQAEGSNDLFDVVVIGFGSAGAVAALEAAENGSRVLLMDTTEGGGATQRSGGVVYLGGGTQSQIDAGFADDADNMYRCLKHECEVSVDDERLRAFCNESKANFDWLADHGVQWVDPATNVVKYHPKKVSLPPGDTTLYWSGNEQAEPWASLATPAPRGHWAWMPGTEQFKDHLAVPARGHVLFNALADACESHPNIEVRAHCKGLKIMKEGGIVVGVTVSELPDFRPLRSLRHVLHMMGSASPEYDLSANVRRQCSKTVNDIFDEFGVQYDVFARGGVVICSGGFFFNDDMVQKHAPEYFGNMALGSLGDDGSGIQMAEDIGAATSLMSKITTWKFIAPPAGFLDGIMVDTKKGKRFTNEDCYSAKIVDRQFARADGRAWILLDSTIMEEIRADTLDPTNDLYPFQRMIGALNTEGLARQGNTLKALARACSLPVSSLEETVNRYNKDVSDGKDTEFGKIAKYLKPLVKAPFYAVPVDAKVGAFQRFCLRNMPKWGMEAARYLPTMPMIKAGGRVGLPLPPSPSLSLGGLRVDLDQRVVNKADFSVIEGLYAAGRSAAGVASGGYVSGLSIGDAIYAGRRAGKHASFRAGYGERSMEFIPEQKPRLQPVAVSKL